MAHQLNSPVISTTLNISFILVDRYQYTSPPLVKHLVRSKNMVEQLGKPYYSYVPEATPHSIGIPSGPIALPPFILFNASLTSDSWILRAKRLLVSSEESPN